MGGSAILRLRTRPLSGATEIYCDVFAFDNAGTAIRTIFRDLVFINTGPWRKYGVGVAY